MIFLPVDSVISFTEGWELAAVGSAAGGAGSVVVVVWEVSEALLSPSLAGWLQENKAVRAIADMQNFRFII
jgi:hypothetical protein